MTGLFFFIEYFGQLRESVCSWAHQHTHTHTPTHSMKPSHPHRRARVREIEIVPSETHANYVDINTKCGSSSVLPLFLSLCVFPLPCSSFEPVCSLCVCVWVVFRFVKKLETNYSAPVNSVDSVVPACVCMRVYVSICDCRDYPPARK